MDRRLKSTGLHRVGHDSVTEHAHILVQNLLFNRILVFKLKKLLLFFVIWKFIIMDSAFGFQYSGYMNGGSIFDPKKKGGGTYT